MKKTIGDPLTIRGMRLKNRICAGPMGNATVAREDGVITNEMVKHFRAVANGGSALIIQGAASVTNENKAHVTQTGIWSDAHVEGLSDLVREVHREDCRIILQLEHAGIRALADEPLAPSPFTLNCKGTEKICRAMTREDIRDVQQEYVSAGRRAAQAGYDGIELHASHGWLISSFLSPCINHRDDEYGRDRMRFIREIFQALRERVPEEFVIGVRLGGFNPDLATGLEQGCRIEEIGFDYINMSNNPVTKWLPQDMFAPEGYPFSPHEYSAAEMKKTVHIPVIGGKSLRTTEEVAAVLAETNIDMITLGRPILADPAWTQKALSGMPQIQCKHCPGRCKWELGGRNCVAAISANR